MSEQNKSAKNRLADARQLLLSNLNEIDTISEWADLVGYGCAKKFSADYRNRYKKRPKKDMINYKLNKAIELIKSNPEQSLYEVALKIGKKDEKSLHAFFKRNSYKHPSYYRNTH